MNKILVINPGSTSTKIAVYEDGNSIFEENIAHSKDELSKYNTILDQFEWRKSLIEKSLLNACIDICSIKAIASRGGIMKPIAGGTYMINEDMLRDIKSINVNGHPSNLAPLISYDLAKENNIKSYVVNPVIVDELDDIARVSGMKEIERISIFHALNQKSVAQMFSKDIGRSYKDLNIIVAHLGGGISIGAHKKGRVVDVNDGLNGDGPFTPERCGSVPAASLVKLCFCGKYTEEQMLQKIRRGSGMLDYLNTNNIVEIQNKCLEGDEKYNFYLNAMCYQISKFIASLSVVFDSKIDGIIITGGIANSKLIVEKIKQKVEFIAPVHIYPGEKEMLALANGVLDVLNGVEELSAVLKPAAYFHFKKKVCSYLIPSLINMIQEKSFSSFSSFLGHVFCDIKSHFLVGICHQTG